MAEETTTLSKEALVVKVQQLEAHVFQLKNLLAKARQESKPNKKQQNRRPFDYTKYNTRHIALKIAYLGWDYQGFVVQEDTDNTIEAAVFEALLKTKLIESRETSNYHRCGRTDKGVSAFGQVISIDLRTNLVEGKGVKVRENGTAHLRPGDKSSEIRYAYIMNKVLPPEIRVLAWCPVDVDFSARFSCKQRTYKYFFPQGDLDLEKLKISAAKLQGEHDFRNLCKMDVGNGVVNFTRNILHTDLKVTENRDGGYSLCEMTIVGQAFLWHQIRCIVAVLFLIAQGKEQPQLIEELLDVEKHPRKPQYTMASELPLCLFDCEFEDVEWIYEKDWHEENIRHLQELWTQHSVKTSMIGRMLSELESTPYSSEDKGSCHCVLHTHVNSLLPGNKPRTYLPLLSRPKCESLEDRIEHFAKRRKIGTTTESNDENQS